MKSMKDRRKEAFAKCFEQGSNKFDWKQTEDGQNEILRLEYRYQEGLLYKRLAVLLVVSSILAAAYTANETAFVPYAGMAVGLVGLQIVWRQFVIVQDLRSIRRASPDCLYRRIRAFREELDAGWHGFMSPRRGLYSGQLILVLGLPLACLAAWVTLAFGWFSV